MDIDNLLETLRQFRERHPPPQYDCLVCLADVWQQIIAALPGSKYDPVLSPGFLGGLPCSLEGLPIHVCDGAFELSDKTKELLVAGRRPLVVSMLPDGSALAKMLDALLGSSL